MAGMLDVLGEFQPIRVDPHIRFSFGWTAIVNGSLYTSVSLLEMEREHFGFKQDYA